MAMKESEQEWYRISEHDLATAEAMLRTGRYAYVAFMCQQAIEKLLKAIYVQQAEELPPRTHNLLYLLDELTLDLAEEDREFLARLRECYIEARYPGQQLDFFREMTEERARSIYRNSQELWECVKQELR